MEINTNMPYIPNTDSSSEISSKLTKAYGEKDDKALKEACQGFESVFLNMMMQEMRKTVSKSDLLSTSFASDTYQGMMDEEITKAASKGKGIGIADAMYKQLSKQLKNTYKVEE